VPIAEPRQPEPPHQGRLGFVERLRWLLADPATWRDLRWTAVNLVAWMLAAAGAAIITLGLVLFIVPVLSRVVPPPAFPGNTKPTLALLGVVIMAAGALAAP